MPSENTIWGNMNIKISFVTDQMIPAFLNIFNRYSKHWLNVYKYTSHSHIVFTPTIRMIVLYIAFVLNCICLSALVVQ